MSTIDNLKIDIPDIAAGKVIPYSINKKIQEEEKQKKRDGIAVWALVVSVLSLILSAISLFISR